MPESLISRETVFAGVLLTVHRDIVGVQDGTNTIREWVEHPGAAAVVPMFDDGSVLLVRQHRYATGRRFLEVPAGKLDSGEAPADAAARELEEETGWRAGRLDAIGAVYPCIGYSDEVIHLFVGTELSEGAAVAGPDEQLEIVRMPFADALAQVRSGEIDDAKTVAALVRAEALVAGHRALGSRQ